MKLLQEAANSKNHEEVIKTAPEVIAMYRDFVEARSAYELLSEAQKAKGNTAGALDALQQYSNAGGRSPETLKKLAKMQTEAGKPADAIKTLERLLYIFPMEEEVHRDLGDLYMTQNVVEGAIREYGAVVASKPVDPAASHFNLARALHTAKRTEDAKEQLLLALEAAPGYKPAQRLLLELSR
jgi:tetratricopeptide (TPR) repeat protein